MTQIIYVVYTKEYLTSRQIIGANLRNMPSSVIIPR